MDEEHEECVAAFNSLLSTQRRSALQELHAVLKDHFAHEEQLLDKHLYAGKQHGGFSAEASARKSHFGDHHRMLHQIEEQLRGGSEAVPAAFIQKVVNEFENHAHMYDMQYAGRF